MKRDMLLYVALFSILFLASFGSALAISSKNGSYMGKETGIISIKGVFYDNIIADNIELKRANVIVPIDFKLQKFDGEYILWFIAPEISNNYTLWIKNVHTLENGLQVRKDFLINFSVNSEQVKYNIKPETLSPIENFSILVNSYADENINILVDFPEEREITIKPGENLVTFPIDVVFGTKRINIGIGSYTLPFLIAGTAKTDREIEKHDLIFRPSFIENESRYFDRYSANFSILNKANRTIKNIEFDYNESLFIVTPDAKFSLNAGQEKYFELKLKHSIKDDVNEEIIIRYENSSVRLPVNLDIEKRNVNISDNKSINFTSDIIDTSKFYCAELNGIVCSEDDECDSDTKKSLNGDCCVGTCEAKKASGGGWIGFVLFLIVIILVGYVIWKYKKAPKTGAETKNKVTSEILRKDIP